MFVISTLRYLPLFFSVLIDPEHVRKLVHSFKVIMTIPENFKFLVIKFQVRVFNHSYILLRSPCSLETSWTFATAWLTLLSSATHFKLLCIFLSISPTLLCGTPVRPTGTDYFPSTAIYQR